MSTNETAAAKPQKPKSESVWMVAICWRNWDNYEKKTGLATWIGCARTRKEIINRYEEKFGEPWRKCYRAGDRCIRVTLSPKP